MSFSIDWLLWLIIASAEIVVFIQAIISNSRRTYQRFTLYLGFSAFSRMFLIALWATTHNFRLYGYATQINGAITLLLIGAAIVEIWGKTFGPSPALPPKTAMKFVITLSGIYPACLLIAELCRTRTGNEFAGWLWSVELAFTSIAASTMLLLIVHSRKLRISWRPVTERIALGFVISLSASAFAALSAGRLVGMLTAQRFSQVAYVAALGVWCWALCSKEVIPEKLDLGTLEMIWRDFKQTEAELTEAVQSVSR